MRSLNDSADRRTLVVIAMMGAVALLIRVSPFVAPGTILAVRGYDDAVMFNGTVALLAGRLPYADFIYLHPPGSLLTILPFASLAPGLSDPGAFAAARIAWILIGTANTLLIGWLLRRFGVWAVVVGMGMYAAWPAVVATEQTVMLEPVLNFCLLTALACIQARRTALLWVAGVGMGLALTVKYWAIVDIAVLLVMVAAIAGVAGLARFAVAGVVTVTAVMLPFFIAAPGAMWEQTVVTQLLRNDRRPPLAERLNLMSPASTISQLDQRVPWWAWAILVLGLIAVSAIPVVSAIVRRRSPGAWPDTAWWGVIVLTHAVALTLSSTFYDHYAGWLIAPLALASGGALHLVGKISFRRAVGAVVLASVAALAVAGMRDIRTYTPYAQLQEWAATRECVWGHPSVLVVADAVSANNAAGCPVEVDLAGARLLLREGGSMPAPDSVAAARAWDQIEASDGVILPIDPETWWMTKEQRTKFVRDFTKVAAVGVGGLWNQRIHTDRGR